MSTRHFPILLTAVPLAFAALCPVVGMWKKKLCFPWALAGAFLTTIFTWSLIWSVSAADPLSYSLAGWKPPWGIEIRVDYPGMLLAAIITGVGLLILLYSWRYIEHLLDAEKVPYYYTLYLLAFTSMLGFSITGDLFNLFVFMELFQITSFVLVGITGEGRALRAGFKYLVMAVSSSVTVLLAIAFLYSITGSLNMADVGSLLSETGYVSAADVALLLMLVSFAVKAALFPLHVWLPDAHSIAPSPVSALLSGLMIKMGVLGIFRVLFTIYGQGFADLSSAWSALAGVLAWAGALAIVAGSGMAIIQKDLKVMIAYSSVSHIGYIILGLCLLTTGGMTGGLFNILAHAMGKACMFMVAGLFIYKHRARRIYSLRGLGRSMPITSGAFAIAAMSIVGLPPTAGFMAKWYLLGGCLERGQYAFVVMVLAGSLLSAIYCFRVVYYLFFTGLRAQGQPLEEGPATMFVPAAVLAAGTLFFGVFSSLLTPSMNAIGQLFLSG